MTDFVIALVERLGYGGIAALMLAEALFPPIPSEVVMPFAGFAAARGNLTVAGVVAAGTVGSLLGALLLYGVGALFKEEKIAHWIEQHGKKIGIRHRDVLAAQHWFDRNGKRAVLIGRVIPGVRSIISLPAGLRRMKLRHFLVYSALGSIAWNIGLAGSGYLLGDAYKHLERLMGPVSAAIALLLSIGFAIYIWKRHKKQKKEDTDQ
jgi:membrane protein DedA with SNARE-associated domain